MLINCDVMFKMWSWPSWIFHQNDLSYTLTDTVITILELALVSCFSAARQSSLTLQPCLFLSLLSPFQSFQNLVFGSFSALMSPSFKRLSTLFPLIALLLTFIQLLNIFHFIFNLLNNTSSDTSLSYEVHSFPMQQIHLLCSNPYTELLSCL